MMDDKQLDEIETQFVIAATLVKELHETRRLSNPEYLALKNSIHDVDKLLAEVKRLRDKLDYMDEYALDTLKTQLKQERERAEEAEKERDAAIKDMTEIAINSNSVRKCLKCTHVNGNACTLDDGECRFEYRREVTT